MQCAGGAMENEGTILERLGKALYLEGNLYTPYERSSRIRREIRRLLRGVIAEMEERDEKTELAQEGAETQGKHDLAD